MRNATIALIEGWFVFTVIRYQLHRAIFRVLARLWTWNAKLLPADHPARIASLGAAEAVVPTIIEATIPLSDPRPTAPAVGEEDGRRVASPVLLPLA